MDYNFAMIEVHQTETFTKWITKLKDRLAANRITARILRLSISGHFGDVKSVREGVSEMRFDYGPGYRVYFMQRGAVTVILLAGGDKGTQAADIEKAVELAKEWRN